MVYYGPVRLSHQSIGNLRFWRSVTSGSGRYLQPSMSDLTVQADAAIVGYGETLGKDRATGSPGSWVGQGFWTAEDRAQSITLRELRTVRLLLHRSFVGYVSSPTIRQILLHEDSQSVVTILKVMVSAIPPMMAGLRKLRKLLHAFGVQLEARWIPSAVNRFADALFQTWNPQDVVFTCTLVQSLQRPYILNAPLLFSRPLNETRSSMIKQIREQLQQPWDDGRSGL